MLRDYEAANRVVDRGWRSTEVDQPLGNKVGPRDRRKGRFQCRRKIVDVLAQPTAKSGGKNWQELSAEKRADLALSRANTALLQGNYEKALAALGDAKDEAFSGKPGSLFGKRFLAGVVQQKLGHAAEAQVAFSSAKELASVEVSAAPNDARGTRSSRVLWRVSGKRRPPLPRQNAPPSCFRNRPTRLRDRS